MPNPMIPAAGAAMPAEGQRTRRAALAALASVPALVMLPAVAAEETTCHLQAVSMADDIDAPLLAMLAQWREAYARAGAIDDRVSEADEAAKAVALPDVLIRTEEDRYLVAAEKVGEYYRTDKSFALMEHTTMMVMGGGFTHAPIAAMITRFEEILAAHRSYVAAVEAVREAVGYPELERLQHEARTEEERLRRDVAVMPARTVQGALAKLAAVANAYGLEDLEEEMADIGDDDIGLAYVALSVARDCARMGAIAAI